MTSCQRGPAATMPTDVRRRYRERGFLVGVGRQDGNVGRSQPPLVVALEKLEEGSRAMEGALGIVM